MLVINRLNAEAASAKLLRFLANFTRERLTSTSMAFRVPVRRNRLSADPRFSLNAICPYFTMFPVEFPLGILKRHPDAQVVVDPFCGRGTTLYAARVRSLRAFGIDCSPVAVAISQAKLARVRLRRCLALAEELISRHRRVAVPTGAFWRSAYHPDTLQELCALRRGLSLETGNDEAVVLRAAALGCLHGPISSTNSYFSNQMPRTFAPKPDYAVKFWKAHEFAAPRVSAISAIERKLRRIAEEDRTAGERCEGAITLGDSTAAGSFGGIRKKIDLAVTSPAYFGMSTYVPDQWLRNWFLGGPANVVYSRSGSLPSSSRDDFAEALGRTWSHLARHASEEFHLYVRFGVLPSRDLDAKELLRESLVRSGHDWRIVSFRAAATADAGRRQARHMAAHAAAATEFDLHATLA